MKLQTLLLTLLIATPSLAEVACRSVPYTRSAQPQGTESPTTQDTTEVTVDVSCPEGMFATSPACNISYGTGVYESSPVSHRTYRCSFTLNNESDYLIDENDDHAQDDEGNLIYQSARFGRARAQVICCK